MTLTDATLRQITAADPARNTWLSANAGSGKTRVLIDRVARLLLSGVEPQHILCLTYTKAAASEMQNRLFDRLGEWAMKPDAELRSALADLGETKLPPGRLDRARQLFARAIETPGGLRIQTIHSFCGSLLRRFPLEAGVSPGFTEMDDRAGRQMRSEIVEEMADGPQAHVVRRMTEVQSGEDFGKLVEDISRHRAHFSPPLDRAGVRTLFGLPDVMDDAHFLSIAFNGSEDWLIAQTLPLLRAGSSTMQDLAKDLAGLNLEAPTRTDLAVLYDCLLKKDGEPNFNKVPTTKVRTAMGDLVHDFDDFMQRVGEARSAEKALAAAEKTLALHGFAAVFLPEYERRKAARGLLDFDDLILRAKALLTNPSLAAWVLYRLDGGIDHILVDEAQDTSPEQWELVEALSAELIAGEGSSSRARTLFVVGDKKQSIYSFQGADVAAFDQMRSHFGERLASGPGLQESVLEHSFRSSRAILDVVDATFTPAEQAALGGGSQHLAFNDALPGRVDVWPIVTKEDKPEPGPWYEPVDATHPEDPQIALARQIAGWIRDRVTAGEQIPQVSKDNSPTERPLRYGDVLILVQRRSGVFHEIIRACKALDLPIAGADRLKLGGELAVKDLSALLAFLDTPEDDLSLAAVLRSPLCSWSEAELFRLANPRKGYLWEALRDHPGHADTRAFLDDMRGQADFLRPYDLIERVLHRHDGRRKLIGRLGPEAEDGIDELLSQALSYEALEVPSLTGFLAWMQTDEVEVKRQLDAEGDRIRVMTVHGAKGLEAELVILPECGDYTPQERDQLFVLPGGPAVWKVSEAESPGTISAERAARKEREAAERLRLLYVAMTRARSWLVATGSNKATQATCWHTLIRAGVEAAAQKTGGAETLDGGILRHSFGTWPGRLVRDTAKPVPLPLPAWTGTPAPDVPRPAQVLSPSDLGGAKALPGEPEAEGKARGVALHLLLERLPGTDPALWPARAAALIADPGLVADALAQTRAILHHPDLAPLFARETLAEVAVTAPWNGRVLAGSIDRLILAPDRVLIIDYKSNAMVPDRTDLIPEGILRQLGAYAYMVGQVYPDRRIETAVLWTRGPSLMPVDPEIVRQALARATIP